jgi:type VI protein secretion system component VasF
MSAFHPRQTLAIDEDDNGNRYQSEHSADNHAPSSPRLKAVKPTVAIAERLEVHFDSLGREHRSNNQRPLSTHCGRWIELYQHG